VTSARWLRKDVILAVHQKTLNEQGGLPGIRDEGLLESALARPANITHYSADSSLYQLAAAYAYGIASNHPFADGNKRVAFYAAAGFLRINGLRLDAQEAEAAAVFIDLAAGEVSEEDLAGWLHRHCAEL
jgi:death-on-curing protein